jgi:hypothetical protein
VQGHSPGEHVALQQGKRCQQILAACFPSDVLSDPLCRSISALLAAMTCAIDTPGFIARMPAR